MDNAKLEQLTKEIEQNNELIEKCSDRINTIKEVLKFTTEKETVQYGNR